MMAEKDFQLAECEFKVKEQEAAILKLNCKIHEKDSEKKKAVQVRISSIHRRGCSSVWSACFACMRLRVQSLAST